MVVLKSADVLVDGQNVSKDQLRDLLSHYKDSEGYLFTTDGGITLTRNRFDGGLEVSPDSGVTWKSVYSLDKATGKISFNTSVYAESAVFNLLQDGGRFGPSPEDQSLYVGAFRGDRFFLPYNGSIFSNGGKFTHANSTNGGTGAALNTDIDQLIKKLKTGVNFYGYGIEFYALKISAGAGTAVPIVIGGITHYLCIGNLTVPMSAVKTVSGWVKCKVGSLALTRDSQRKLYIDGVLQAANAALTPADGWKQVTIIVSRNAKTYFGYDNFLQYFGLTPGGQMLLAAPFICPGDLNIQPGQEFGLVPSLEAWR